MTWNKPAESAPDHRERLAKARADRAEAITTAVQLGIILLALAAVAGIVVAAVAAIRWVT